MRVVTEDTVRVAASERRAGMLRPGQFMRPRDIVNATGLAKATVYDYIKRGKLPSVRIGRCVLVPTDEVQRLLSEGD